MHTITRAAAAILTSMVVAGCTVGPNYQRPPAGAPDAFRGQTGDQASAAPASSLGDERWWQVFQDEALQGLIRAALDNNYSVRMAAARILEAQAQLGITRADQFPAVSAGVDVLGERPSVALGYPAENIGALEVQASVAWQLDFWGQFRRATEAARAQLVASEWGRRAVVTTLIGEVASAYFGLRALDLELEISRRTLASRQESLQLTQVREQGGATSLLDVRQAEQLVYGATAEIVTLEREIEQQENFISVLLGSNPAAVVRGRALTEQPHPPDVPAGLPSMLLERRPDIQQAELQLVAANAQIGVARSAYFPQIALTGSGGFESTALTALFTGPSAIWTVALGATQPIFTAGRLKSNVNLARAQTEHAVVQYQKTIQTAFTEVSDALIAHQRVRESREKQEALVSVLQDRLRLAYVRYRGGVDTQLDALDADRDLFQAQLDLAQIRLQELLSVVQLYKALGGGWQ